MGKIKEDNFKELLLNEMVCFDSFCRSNNIRYYLFYGSLLGAARHKGFIPWDDDIDVVVPRSDYQRLVNIFNEKNERYKLISMHNNDRFAAPLAKVIDTHTKLIQHYGFKENVDLGIYIDVFVFDGLPQNLEERNRYLENARKLSKSWRIAAKDFNCDNRNIILKIFNYIHHLSTHLLGYRYFLKKIDSFASRYNFDNSDYVSNLMLTSCDFAYPRKYFNSIELPFEGHNFIAPSGYDELLTLRYGDWRTPPQKDVQKSHHKYECYLVE